ncbi:hypothetical protein GH733_000980, partial [Mirounga leonina]
MLSTTWFFIYEVTSTFMKYTWDIYKELLIFLLSSLFMGFGVLFPLLWGFMDHPLWGSCGPNPGVIRESTSGPTWKNDWGSSYKHLKT